MLAADHPNALWLRDMYRERKADPSHAGLSEKELDQLHAEHIAKQLGRLSPNLIIHTGGVKLAVTGDMAFLKAYSPRRASLSDGGDVTIIKMNQVLADDTYGILHFQLRIVRGDQVWEGVGMGAWRFENGMAVEHWELADGPKWDAFYLGADPDFNGDAIEYWTRPVK